MKHVRLFIASLSFALIAACASTGGPPPPMCTGSCSTHEEGYQWAMRGALTDPKPCDDKTYGAEFVRGCKDAVNDYSELRPASQGL